METNLIGGASNYCYLQKFRLYETRSNFYMIGRDKNRTLFRVLKIGRLEPSELVVLEDSTTYSESECFDLRRRIHEGNKSTGGLKFVTICYGIVGFIKLLGPHYMLLITKRRKIGAICGHAVYSITKSEMIPIPNSTVQSNMTNSKNENRYKKLLCTVDLTRDFFFSYSYHVMHSLQKNLSCNETGQGHYESMFVWNEFLTRGIRNNLKNSLWTVALVYGFFKQVKLSVSGREFKLALIARRSRHYAGTRYLKRGVNEKGRVANDVETEQIMFEDVPEEQPMQISSVVQNRGSIPLFWSQETSRLNIKPDIMLSRKDQNFEATKLHFENLVKRYGNPIIILNLIKSHEKKPRETILRAEFANAIRFINKSLPKENRLKFLHWDLHKHSRKATNVLALLGRVASYALNLTGIFYCQVMPSSSSKGLLNGSCVEERDGDYSLENPSSENGNVSKLDSEIAKAECDANQNQSINVPMFQSGVLRTNCIDCLDRTNVAQYAYGLVALGHQLHALGYMESPSIDLDNPLAEDLMRIYETMGDTLALQYGGSAAHNKIFSERRGQWKAATQSQEFFRTLQRYYSNAYMDAEKQDAINVFLGHFQPQQGKPALWELDSDQHCDVGRRGPDLVENARSFIKRSLSDGNLRCENESPVAANIGYSKPLSEKEGGVNNGLSDSNPEISTCESDISYSRYTPSMPCRKLFKDVDECQCFESNHICYDEHGDACSCSNFLDMDWLSTSGNSCEEDLCDRSSAGGLSSENLGNDVKIETTISASESGPSLKGRSQTGSSDDLAGGFPDRFVRWVMSEEMLFH
ncbi:PREDICTED: phosphoinositide phosphatase SAC2 [Populus euphratica]|uniref:Phosphoinositide phosphatase SAC2 n=1 Tax=Populus euphratica TaxID=75702 RepID=A0AAJ6UWG7_POPEU|nr:PREDICTED: phosphoinositide phosphatase SAC2 [Populus euphratica]XP_011036523.1 PREDICTED: phosphoinositide phosphatase SAC2 [Populus euphratica]XP_011036524.1 PREDICTED: phosphoinositide phosphatase SAC2 [Populus euphratica]XP_011036525.1 PREDICTED: phosphoinositide phosphatase SAC2 [Populus euphratica]XP_011036526.1 PREDICTED: phosphoinositide phosphatase SAC2 [Populus euphratica]XP_011036527.1 PREDICTED: phosphoinositide phosphatase SAC2 [Populus euphratica]